MDISDGLDFVGLEVMKTAKGRDKVAAFVQNFSKWYSLSAEVGTPHHAGIALASPPVLSLLG